jgi:cytochrome c biogenesis protein ResB
MTTPLIAAKKQQCNVMGLILAHFGLIEFGLARTSEPLKVA